MSSAKQSGAVLWMCVQIIAQVVIKAGNHGREQTNICFQYKPPFTILRFSDRVSFQGRRAEWVIYFKITGPVN